MAKVALGWACSTGARTSNEDNYLVCRAGLGRFRVGDLDHTEPQETRGLLLAVADGMGGHQHGALASEAAVRALARLAAADAADPRTALRDFLVQSHASMRTQLPNTNMGTTVTAAWMHGRTLSWVHIGDSRLYHLGASLKRLTIDQTHVEFCRRDGRTPKADVPVDALAQAFLFGSRGLGNGGAIRIDDDLDTGVLRLQAGDRVLLCSDGVSRFVPEDEITSILRTIPAGQAAKALTEAAMRHGSDDNVTAITLAMD